MPTSFTEGAHAGDFVVSEAPGARSRDQITIASGQDLDAGAILGKIAVDTTVVFSATGNGAGNNTGNGTIANGTTGVGSKPGDYRLTCIGPNGNVTPFFTIEDPDGVLVGTAKVGTAFTGPINGNITNGGANFAIGDTFKGVVAAGSGKMKEYNPANTDGSGIAVGILFDNVDATGGDVIAVDIARDAEVAAAGLAWFANATTDQKAAGLAQLEAKGIVARS